MYLIITYHAKFQVKIPTGSPIILTLNFVFEPISFSVITGFKNDQDRTLRVGPNCHKEEVTSRTQRIKTNVANLVCSAERIRSVCLRKSPFFQFYLQYAWLALSSPRP